MLNDKQKKAVSQSCGNTIISASPGSGKTRTLVARAQYKLRSLPSFKILALITYTNAAADEIASRLIMEHNNAVFVGTIHRFCLEFILRPFGWIYNWAKPRIITHDELLRFLELNPDMSLGMSPLEELNKIKKDLNGELDNNVDWNNPVPLKYVADLYFDFLDSNKAIDFNEILHRSYRIVTENKFVVNSLSNKFYEILVDEFQDTNIYQYEILREIDKMKICTLFMVGDEKQRILRFAGAIDNALSKASEDFNAPIEVLDKTYRSTPNIIKAFSSLFEDHPVLINESSYKERSIPIKIYQTKIDNHNSTIEGLINTLLQNNVLEESEIAILSTRWTDALQVSRHLRKKYRVVGLGALPHRFVSNSTFSLIRSISRYLHSSSIKHLRTIKRNIELHVLENDLSLSESELSYSCNALISRMSTLNVDLSLSEGLCAIKTILDNIFRINHSAFDELIDLISDEEKDVWTIEKYLETLSGVGGITVNTIHQVKGLEYEVVILNQMNEGRIPYRQWERDGKYYHPATKEAVEDGRTLFYVGISRAKALLIILHGFSPSQFIDALDV